MFAGIIRKGVCTDIGERMVESGYLEGLNNRERNGKGQGSIYRLVKGLYCRRLIRETLGFNC